MKNKKKNIIISITALGLAGVLAVNGLFHSAVAVEASSAMMPGIETIINSTTKAEPFKILEIVDNKNEAEIGYYISGQEPSLKLYEYKPEGADTTRTFTSVEEGLSVLPTFAQRKSFVENSPIKEGEDTKIKDIKDTVCGDDVDTYPLSYEEYKEKYFLTDEDKKLDWKEVSFENGEKRTVTLSGHYEKVNPGDGDYTKNEVTYYPVRTGIDTDSQKAEYRQNVQGFVYAGDGQTQSNPYQVDFVPVTDASGNYITEITKDQLISDYDYKNGKYGYYENIYRELTESVDFNTFPGEKIFLGDLSVENVSENPENIFQAEEIFSGNDVFQDSMKSENEFGDSSQNTDELEENLNNSRNTPVSNDNPMIYRAEILDRYPNYRYTEYMTLDDLKDSLVELSSDRVQAYMSENSIDTVVTIDPDTRVYKLWSLNVFGGLNWEYLYYVQGRQPVSMRNVNSLPNDYYGDYGEAFGDSGMEENHSKLVPYFYKVSQVEFSCEFLSDDDITPDNANDYPEAYQYTGWYYAYTPENEEVYVKIGEGETATYYTSEDEFLLNPGKGDYVFVPGGEDSVKVEVSHLFYRGGYTNHDWLKRYVFNLSPDSEETAKQFDDFSIDVETQLTSVFEKKIVEGTLEEDNTENQNLQAQEDLLGDENEQIEIFDENNQKAVSETDVEENDSIQEDNSEESDEHIDSYNEDAEESDFNESDENDVITYNDENYDQEGEESQVEPMVSEAMEELVSFESSKEESEIANEPEQQFEEQAFGDNQEADDIVDILPNEEDNSVAFTDSEEDAFSSDEEPLFMSDNTSDKTPTVLEKYDLIYVNGSLSVEAARAIADSGIPCIINQDKALDKENGEGLRVAFETFLRQQDQDGHYVNTYVYFFRNTMSSEAGNASALVNLNFNDNFNTDADGATEDTVPDAVLGFEEILQYIERENQYRALGNTSQRDVEFQDERVSFTSNDTSEDGGISANSESGITPLSTHISQARVIEYILNYKYKRIEVVKDKINVLNIEPAQVEDSLTEVDVIKWMTGTDEEGVKFINPEVCCFTSTNNGNPRYLLDGDVNTRWQNDWPSSKKHTHWFRLEIEGNPSMLKGIVFTPRQEAYVEGYPKQYSIKILESDKETVIREQTGYFDSKENYRQEQTVYFDEMLPADAKYIVFTFLDTISNDNVSASCAEVKAILPLNISVDTMTSSEYVGHIDDINSTYDLIYIGDSIGKNRNIYINGESPMLYTHVGAARSAYLGPKDNNKIRYLGLLDNEIEDIETNNGEYTQREETIKIVREEKGQKNTYFEEKVNVVEKKKFLDVRNYSLSGAGYLRGSGNDITKQQYRELMDYVKSGYPIVLGDSLIITSSNEKKVNTKTVDASSYFYKFLKEAINYPNVIKKDDLENDSLTFFANLSKPVIDFSEGSRPPEVPDSNGGTSGDSATGYISDNNLKYVFKIKDNASIAPATTTYNCSLFLDLNFDGNFSSLEEQQKYVEITNKNGEVVPLSQYGENEYRYELKADETYTLTRKIPEDYYKVIAWKLEVTNNVNGYIRTSDIGYAKQKNNSMKKPEINVLQIMPDIGVHGKNGTWILGGDNADKSFKTLISNVPDFAINVTSVTISEFEENAKEYLSGKQMLIIGFDDSYPNISNDEHQVDLILEFIKQGKSVIFSHDTVSYINWDFREMSDEVKDLNGKDVQVHYNWLWDTAGNPLWGYSLNWIIRSVVGMDRYGIQMKEPLSENGNATISDLLRQGRELSDGDPINIDGETQTVSFETLERLAGDVAYKKNDETRSSSYSQTHGYTNIHLQNVNFGNSPVTEVTKVNEGAITQYPFKMQDKIKVSSTHGQSCQLALERDRDINNVSDGKNDIVVWYCLGGANSLYSQSPNDVRNNYYFYSNGNVIYTGAGHDSNKTEDEKRLFINAIVAAANVTAVQPEVNFVKSLDPAAQTENTRYYITDQENWSNESSNVLEKDMDFYFNVRDYNMVSASLDLDSQSNQNMEVEFFIGIPSTEIVSAEEQLPEFLQGMNLISVTDKIEKLSQYGSDIPVTERKIRKNGDIGGFLLNKNNAYGFKLPNIEGYIRASENSDLGQYRSVTKLYVKVTSTVTLYGKENNKTSWAVLDLKQRQLFNLD